MRYTFLTTLVFLAACGAGVSNTDKPTGIYIAGAPPVEDVQVQVVQSSPPNTGQIVEGVACKNKIWEGTPTREAAIAVLKREAAKNGYSKVRVLSVEESGFAADPARNCWSTVVASGIAFN
jgi:hypothetical protein